MRNAVTVFLDRFFAVAGALLLAQFPQYYQQYLLCLSGHVSELAYQVDSIIQTAQKSHKTLQQFIQKFLNNNDPDFHQQGEFMQALVDRLEHLTNVLKSLQESSVILQPFRLFWNMDAGVAKETCAQFKFGLVLNFESFVYLVLGMFLGYFLFQGILWGINKLR